MLLFCAAMLALIAFGIVLLAKTQLFFQLTEGWKHQGDVDEPSELYLWGARLGGVICILTGICALLVLLLA